MTHFLALHGLPGHHFLRQKMSQKLRQFLTT